MQIYENLGPYANRGLNLKEEAHHLLYFLSKVPTCSTLPLALGPNLRMSLDDSNGCRVHGQQLSTHMALLCSKVRSLLLHEN